MSNNPTNPARRGPVNYFNTSRAASNSRNARSTTAPRTSTLLNPSQPQLGRYVPLPTTSAAPTSVVRSEPLTSIYLPPARGQPGLFIPQPPMAPRPATATTAADSSAIAKTPAAVEVSDVRNEPLTSPFTPRSRSQPGQFLPRQSTATTAASSSAIAKTPAAVEVSDVRSEPWTNTFLPPSRSRPGQFLSRSSTATTPAAAAGSSTIVSTPAVAAVSDARSEPLEVSSVGGEAAAIEPQTSTFLQPPRSQPGQFLSRTSTATRASVEKPAVSKPAITVTPATPPARSEVPTSSSRNESTSERVIKEPVRRPRQARYQIPPSHEIELKDAPEERNNKHPSVDTDMILDDVKPQKAVRQPSQKPDKDLVMEDAAEPAEVIKVVEVVELELGDAPSYEAEEQPSMSEPQTSKELEVSTQRGRAAVEEEVTQLTAIFSLLSLKDEEEMKVIEPSKQMSVGSVLSQTREEPAAAVLQITDHQEAPAPAVLEVVDDREAPAQAVLEISNAEQVAGNTAPAPYYFPLPVNINDNRSILEALAHKAKHTGSPADAKALAIFEQCCINIASSCAVQDIVRLEVRGEVEFILRQVPSWLSALETSASQILVGDLAALPPHYQIALVLSYSIEAAATIQQALRIRLEEVVREQEIVAREIALQQLHRAQAVPSLILDHGTPIATPIPSGKKPQVPSWKVVKRTPLPRFGSIYSFKRNLNREAEDKARAQRVISRIVKARLVKASGRKTTTQSQLELRKFAYANAREQKDRELKHPVITTASGRSPGNPAPVESPLTTRSRKRSHQEFSEDNKDIKLQGRSLKEALLLKTACSYKITYSTLMRRGFRPRTKSQRQQAARRPVHIVHKGTRAGLPMMLAFKRLCVNVSDPRFAAAEDKDQQSFDQAVIRQAKMRELNAQKDDHAGEDEGNSVNDLEWDDKSGRLGSTSRNASQEDLQNIGLADLLLEDEVVKSPLRLGLSERRTGLRSQEQAERELQAREERERQALEEKLRAERLGRIAPTEGLSLFPPLTNKLQELVDGAITTSNPHKELCLSFEGIPLHGKDFHRLRPGAWLNDEIINAFIGMNVQHVKQMFGHKRKAIPTVELFLSSFYTNLETGHENGDGAYSKVKRWASKKFMGGKDFLKCNLLITPVNLGDAHWTLLAFWPKHRVVEFYDSFHSEISEREVLSLAKEFVEGELASHYIDSEWTFRRGKSPSQQNGFDCGVFVCTTAKMLLQGYEPQLSYSGANMALQRKRIAAELLKGDLKGELAPTLAEGWLR